MRTASLTHRLALPAARAGARYIRFTRVGVLIAVALACCVPPPAAMPAVLAPVIPGLYRTWIDACSIVIAALPYVSAGAAAAAATEAVALRWRAAPARAAALAFTLLFPGCDCAMSSFAASLRLLPPRLALACMMWSSCCNPVSLVCTATVLGTRMLVLRMCGGLIAACLIAIVKPAPTMRVPCSADRSAGTAARRFSVAATGAVWSLCAAACLSAPLLVYRPHALSGAAPPAAALLGSLLSPCSTADAVLAAAFFRRPHAQLSFILASQLIDFRQLSLMQRTFGTAVMLRSSAAALAAVAAVCALPG